MLKQASPVKIEQQAANALRRILEEVPAVEHLEVRNVGQEGDRAVDLIAHIDLFGRRHTLVAEVKSSGQPRHVRAALLQLKEYAQRQPEPVTPVFIAPYLSAEAQALCREYDVAFIDLEGNARLAFSTFFVSRQVASKPVPERRELRSLFKPKSAQVLRRMLRAPGRAWRVTELAEAAEVSLGHVSNVRTSLLDREWAQLSGDGVFLSDPDGLLDAWRDAYEPPIGKRLGFYTILHGASFEDAMRKPLASMVGGQIALASFSAAQWLASYGRTGTHYFYADEAGLEHLRSTLGLSPSSKGENVVVTVLEEPGLFLDTVEPAPDVTCTSPVQTYLDLSNAGERGREAADHLRQERLQWPTGHRANPSTPATTTTAPRQPSRPSSSRSARFSAVSKANSPWWAAPCPGCCWAITRTCPTWGRWTWIWAWMRRRWETASTPIWWKPCWDMATRSARISGDSNWCARSRRRTGAPRST